MKTIFRANISPILSFQTTEKFMKKFTFPAFLLAAALFAVSDVSAQRRGKTPPPPSKPKPLIFAVLSDGTSLEPIGAISSNLLVATTGGDAESKALTKFAADYYKPKTSYKLIFGGMPNGASTVKSYNTTADFGKNLATISTVSPKAKLKDNVMALATNLPTGKTKSTRRMPTAAERAEIETLVRAEYARQGVSSAALKNLHYLNLTAIDVNNDGKVEIVGSYWTANSAKERNQLFFIAEQNAQSKYEFGVSDYKKVTPEEVMSGDLKDLDNGTYNELLLDSFDYTGDKSDEIFTVIEGFEGNSFNVYSKKGGKWTKVFEGSNYHGAY